jgi:hypothetical protein
MRGRRPQFWALAPSGLGRRARSAGRGARGRDGQAARLAVVVNLNGDVRVSDMTFHDLAANPLLVTSLGVGLSYLGYGPFSSKKKPTAEVAVVGLPLRLVGSLLLVWAVFLWVFVISMIMPPFSAR